MNSTSAPSPARAKSSDVARTDASLHDLLRAMQSVQAGDFTARVSSDWDGVHGKLADTFNDIIAANQRMASELERINVGVGKQGKTRQRFSLGGRGGSWSSPWVPAGKPSSNLLSNAASSGLVRNSAKNAGVTLADMDSMRLAHHREDVRDRFQEILAVTATTGRRGVNLSSEDRERFGMLKLRTVPMSPTQPAPTLTTLPDDILHYSDPRILTVREYARLQSFPDWFTFHGKYTTGGNRRKVECPRYTQVGNAVPPLLAQAIGAGILGAWKSLNAVAIGGGGKRRVIKKQVAIATG